MTVEERQEGGKYYLIVDEKVVGEDVDEGFLAFFSYNPRVESEPHPGYFVCLIHPLLNFHKLRKRNYKRGILGDCCIIKEQIVRY